MGWLGLDDTDSLQGGCTTASFHALLADLPSDVKTGVPRLVRLWPFAQRRTRGNAALAVELKAPDEDVLMEHLDDWWMHHLAPLEGAVEASMMSDRPQSPASPGMVYYRERPDEAFYWDAVREEVDILSIPTPQRAWGGHGKIGAAAAVSWPAQTTTWEAIAWRSTTEPTQSRRIDMNALLEIDGMEGVVLSRDPRNGSGLIAPRGASPFFLVYVPQVQRLQVVLVSICLMRQKLRRHRLGESLRPIKQVETICHPFSRSPSHRLKRIPFVNTPMSELMAPPS